MRNKQVEELLNKMKKCYGVMDYYLAYNEVDLLLNYIKGREQLEEENKYLKRLCQTQNNREYRSKFLKEFQKKHGKNVFPDYDEIYKRYDRLKEKIEQLEKECKELKDRNKININRNIEAYRIVEQLENNRDKAIEYLEEDIKECKYENRIDRGYLIKLLKGDSDV